MKKLLTFILELVRVLVIVVLLLALFFGLNEALMKAIHGDITIHPLLGTSQFIGFLMIVMVIYRNKLQFTGFFLSGDEQPYSKTVTRRMLNSAVILVTLPYFLLFF